MLFLKFAAKIVKKFYRPFKNRKCCVLVAAQWGLNAVYPLVFDDIDEPWKAIKKFSSLFFIFLFLIR